MFTPVCLVERCACQSCNETTAGQSEPVRPLLETVRNIGWLDGRHQWTGIHPGHGERADKMSMKSESGVPGPLVNGDWGRHLAGNASFMMRDCTLHTVRWSLAVHKIDAASNSDTESHIATSSLRRSELHILKLLHEVGVHAVDAHCDKAECLAENARTSWRSQQCEVYKVMPVNRPEKLCCYRFPDLGRAVV